MRLRLLALALPLTLAACDAFGGPDPTSADALVGAWTVERSHSGAVVVSDRDQDVADVTAEARRGLEVSGAVDAELTFLHYAFPGSHAAFGTTRQFEPCGTALCTDRVTLLADAAGERVELFADGTSYDGDPADVVIERTDAGYALAPFTLTASGGSATVTVGGEIELATRSLEADRPTPVADFRSSPSYSDGTDGLTFRADGTYTSRVSSGETSGTWEVSEPGLARLTPERGPAHGLAFEVRDGRLWSARVFDGGGSEDASEVEARARAAAGSLRLLNAHTVTVSARAR